MDRKFDRDGRVVKDFKGKGWKQKGKTEAKGLLLSGVCYLPLRGEMIPSCERQRGLLTTATAPFLYLSLPFSLLSLNISKTLA